jgi:hypothetical protein
VTVHVGSQRSACSLITSMSMHDEVFSDGGSLFLRVANRYTGYALSWPVSDAACLSVHGCGPSSGDEQWTPARGDMRVGETEDPPGRTNLMRLSHAANAVREGCISRFVGCGEHLPTAAAGRLRRR